MTGIEELHRQRAHAQATAEAAAAQIAEHEERVATEQAARRAAWDAGFVAEFQSRTAALAEEGRVADQAFRAAVLDSPLMTAWIARRAIYWRRDALISQVQGSLVRLGREQEMVRYPSPSYRDPRLLEDVLDLADDEARERAEADRLALDEDREGHVTGSTDAT